VERYVGVDISQGSLENFAERIRGKPNLPPSVSLIHADLGKLILHKDESEVLQEDGSWSQEISLPESIQCPVVSIQFSIHYLFKSLSSAQTLFSNIAFHLKPKGRLVFTTLDPRVLSSYFEGHARSGRGGRKVDLRDGKGRLLCELEMPNSSWLPYFISLLPFFQLFYFYL